MFETESARDLHPPLEGGSEFAQQISGRGARGARRDHVPVVRKSTLIRRREFKRDSAKTCPAVKLVVELDGGQHVTKAAMVHDEIRSRFLRGRGYRVLRFPDHEVFRNPRLVLETILHAVHEPERAWRAFDPSPKIPAGFSTLPQGEADTLEQT